MLEIKYSDGKSFIMSANEFNVGCKNPLYDFALVSPKEIKIKKRDVLFACYYDRLSIAKNTMRYQTFLKLESMRLVVSV